MAYHVAALQAAIEKTLNAIEDGEQQVEKIVARTWQEVQELEQEYESVKQECTDAINRVEETERHSRRAREQLVQVNRGIYQYTHGEMKDAYEKAQALQMELGQWREREAQLRRRRDELARRLKSLRISAHEAETLMVKFGHVTDYLTEQFGGLANTLQTAQTESLVGLQVMQMQEDERRVLAQRLHDGPMQSLAGTAMRVQVVPVADDNEELKEDIRLRLNSVIANIRQIVFDLRPPLLDDLGLIPALKRYTQQWAEWSDVTVHVHLIGVETVLRPTEKMTIFRTVQETLKNTLAHAQASQVDISLTYGVDRLKVEVVDNGIGIGESQWYEWVENGKLGLTVSRQRLGLLNGSLEVMNALPKGTKVVMELPILRGGSK
ncbi:sensor histidine kinase [Alicyclobacillus sp. SO9]|uniref:sensor histidine kinase n=1 Tax=Alicyclobacillus sp. SO9 TaxID=2665646 RepID=UPI0018E74572|nr:sensor histidine kinase [Alicyclobacillus sp. SO9]QQE78129.1 hypothetical protein GI364_19925 [Alicyclobacillus sp. SO9]